MIKGNVYVCYHSSIQAKPLQNKGSSVGSAGSLKLFLVEAPESPEEDFSYSDWLQG